MVALEKMSRHMAYLLRHTPSFVNSEGWASVASVELALSERFSQSITREVIQEIVSVDEKSRYEIQGNSIRAVQGHSHPVNSGLVESVPPELLYHGTASESVASIKEKGLLSLSRTHVHLSSNVETAQQVGSRHSKNTEVLTIRARAAHEAGIKFFISKNGVWLVEHVPTQFIA